MNNFIISVLLNIGQIDDMRDEADKPCGTHISN